MDPRIKTTIAAGLDRLGILALLRSRRASRRGIILTFHRVLPQNRLAECYDPHLAISAELFEQLLVLLKHEFDIVSLEAIARQPGSSTGKQRVAITFDDGWIDTCAVAFPLLFRHSVPATVFVCSALTDAATQGAVLPEERFARIWESCAQRNLQSLTAFLESNGVSRPSSMDRSGWSQQLKRVPMDIRLRLLQQMETDFAVPASEQRRFITWDEVRTMAAAGIAIGSHTSRHCTLPTESDATVQEELSQSRHRIVEETGITPMHFAYPNGAFDVRTAALVGQAGFSHAFTTEAAQATASHSPWTMPRISMDSMAIADSDGNLYPAGARLALQALR